MRRAWMALLACLPLLAAAQWTQVPGALRYVAVGSATNIWGVNASDNIFRWNGSGWVQVPGALRFIAAAADGTVWGVNGAGTPFRWGGNDWVKMPGTVSAVSVGSAQSVFGITKDNGDGTGGTLFYWGGSAWINLDPQAATNITSVAADSSGNTWLTDRFSHINYRLSNGSGQRIAGGLIQVSGGGRYVMGLNTAGQIWRWTGRSWAPVPGALKWISVSQDGQAWGVNSAGNIFRSTAIPADPPIVASQDRLAVLPSGQSLSEMQCLLSTNKRYQACLSQGVLSVGQTPSYGGTYFVSPYGADPSRTSSLVVDYDGSVCVNNEGGRRWCGLAPVNARTFLVMQDDGNLCAYPGMNLQSQQGGARWCTNTGRGAIEKALNAYPKTPYSDVRTALQIFDTGAPLLNKIPPNTNGMSVGLGDPGHVSYCLELSNTGTRPLLVESVWEGGATVRDWAVIPAGQKLRFDDRGRSWVTCLNCAAKASLAPGVQDGSVYTDKPANWGSELKITQIASADKWPAGGCNDMLGLGASH